VNTPVLRAIAAVTVGLAAAVVIVGAAVVLFLNPIWVGFEQDRSGVDRLTGYTAAQVREVTGSILSDLIVGPPEFDVSVDGAPVLDARERSHMADVRGVLLRLGLVAVLGAAVLVAVGLASRGARWLWRAVCAGAFVLAAAVVVVGIAFTVFFEQAFELFHRIFFPPGSYTFDTGSERLVQLFPEQFWSETSVAIAVAVLVLAVVVAVVTRRLGRERGPTSRGLAVEAAG
jgi:integral membrane protein (TIGR01906 family)